MRRKHGAKALTPSPKLPSLRVPKASLRSQLRAVIMRRRVGSLLEVGTGFHSELTGEENIYLSSTILGMSSREISNKFDEIVAFAEVEKYLDTLVKRCSSGMSVRLGAGAI